MFGKAKENVPAVAKPPMVSGGAAMMLKSMGINPEEMERLTEAFLTEVSAMHKRVEDIESRLRALELQQVENTALLIQIAASVSR